ncbi:hypothetical protein [uncultured Dokdonia sp.]|uniref:hypothetical protein n=1 Tax=uncultured Dokdonia sp. TaxID=575653 RepID=UPI00260939EB|nr:hypothetical protein [uncultured Dokdonia sp.]
MENFDSIEWSVIWDIIKNIVLPQTGTLIFNTIIFLFLGLIISIFYVIILHKKKVLKRKQKYYNWATKLYIPVLIIGFLFLFGNIGFITGVYKVLDHESEAIISSVYNNILKLSFESEESKNEYISKLQQSAREVKDSSNALEEYLKITATEYNTGYSVIDDNKNKLANFLIGKYGDDIYKISVYGMLNAAGAKAHVNIDESLSYEEFSTGMDFLLDVGHKDIEQAIKDKLIAWFDSLLYNQYTSLVISQLAILLIIICLPLIDFFIYKKWIEPKYSN